MVMGMNQIKHFLDAHRFLVESLKSCVLTHTQVLHIGQDGVFTRSHKVIISTSVPEAPGFIILLQCVHSCTYVIETRPVITRQEAISMPLCAKFKHIPENVEHTTSKC